MRNRQHEILDLGSEITQEEIDQSHEIFALLQGKKIVAARLLSQTTKELFLEFDDGTRLFVNNFTDQYDVSITGGNS